MTDDQSAAKGSTDSPDYEWDAFISYASEDRKPLVEPLVSLLASLGVNVWWDKFELSVGDSLTTKIALGLSRSRFGVVVISPAFLAKPWPEYELRGLTVREVGGRSKVVLPIWFGVGFDDIVKKAYSGPGKTIFAHGVSQ